MMGKCEKYYVANIYMGYLAAYEYNHLGLKGVFLLQDFTVVKNCPFHDISLSRHLIGQ